VRETAVPGNLGSNCSASRFSWDFPSISDQPIGLNREWFPTFPPTGDVDASEIEIPGADSGL
jgi:hypothetical protein